VLQRKAVIGAVMAALFAGPVTVTPAHATHACDPDFAVLCAHPEDVLDPLCDRFPLIDKILDKVTNCGTD
jgi:hypothetical protein